VAIDMGGEEIADGRETGGTEGMALQQRSGPAAVLGGELHGQGRERCLGGESGGRKVGPMRWENDQNDSSSSSSSKSESPASMDARPGVADVRACPGPLEPGTKIRERKLG
jgi:hypothetical protein